MVDWLVITADSPGAGRGVRGHALLWFLRTYFGRRSVRCIKPDQLDQLSDLQAKYVLLGLPTTTSAELIADLRARIQCDRFAVFDYFDQHQLAWTSEQEGPLRELTGLYLKPWFEPTWDYGMRMGLLPIRRYGRFTWALRFDRWLAPLRSARRPVHDVAFVGRPNLTSVFRDGQVQQIDQRTRWLIEICRDAPELKLWGGLVETNPQRREQIIKKYGPADALFFSGDKVNFGAYFHNICRSRVLLAPGGNVPWTYRHYECLYAGAAVVTIDFRHRDMLIPLPRESMVHVPDAGSVVPAVHEALQLYNDRPTLGADNRAFLEQYLRNGAYARDRVALQDRFVAQFN